MGWLSYIAAALIPLVEMTASARADDAVDPAVKAPTREIGLLPLVGGDTDIGIAFGVIASVASLGPHHKPYKWKLDVAGYYAFKGSLRTEDGYALLTVPALLDGRMRLEIRPSYTKDSTLQFFGLGDAAPEPRQSDPALDNYARLHPALSVDTTWVLRRPWFAVLGAQYTYNQVSFAPSSTLASQMQSADPYVRSVLAIVPDHSVLRFESALVYDTRDNEVSPYDGQYHMIKLRESPAIGSEFPYAYQQVDAEARFYYTPIRPYLTLTARGVFDVQLGDPPFYELSRYEETSAIGGALGVRGVPAYSFYGKVKAFANFEARSEAFDFHLRGKRYIVGFAGFFDAGRLWMDIATRHPDLDGTGLGLHYGIGGGVRLQQGKTFVVRGDLAWSPDARPVGAYLFANQIF
jgi:hypothetical protein